MTYEIWYQSRHLVLEETLSRAAAAKRLGVDPRTVAKALEMEAYHPPRRSFRGSMLDPWKGIICGKLKQFPELSATRIDQMIREDGYPGKYGLVKNYVAEIRSRLKPAYRTLTFLPGECAQVDWGCWKTIDVEGTRRRLNFFVMVLGHSRMMYAELSFAQSMEHWLLCHRHAFEFFGGVPERIMVDNCRTAVKQHQRGCEPVYNDHYLDLAAWYGFTPVACTVRRANEKGQVENAVGYIKKSFFPGRPAEHFAALQEALRDWLANTANTRLHRTTGKAPIDIFRNDEQAALRPLPGLPYDCSVIQSPRADSRFRVTVDTNRYSVPAQYASCRLTLCLEADSLELLHNGECIARHTRSYGRRKDIADPEHEKQLLERRRHARTQRMLRRFLRLTPGAERYCAMLRERRPDWKGHLRRIVALAELHGDQPVARALEDAMEFDAYSSDYIENILERRSRHSSEPGALHLTRREDMLEITLPEPDLSLYTEENENDKESS